jgi:hypothetical protein
MICTRQTDVPMDGGYNPIDNRNIDDAGRLKREVSVVVFQEFLSLATWH